MLRAELRSPVGPRPPASCTGCRRCGVFVLQAGSFKSTCSAGIACPVELMLAWSHREMLDKCDLAWRAVGGAMQAMTVGKGSGLRSTPPRAAARTVRRTPVACVQAGIPRSRGANVASAATPMPVRYTRCSL